MSASVEIKGDFVRVVGFGPIFPRPTAPINYFSSHAKSKTLETVQTKEDKTEHKMAAEDHVETNAIESIEATIRQAHGMDAQQVVLQTLLDISREIPENVNQLTPAMAEHLAGRFLKGLELCGELYAMAVSYELKTEILKKKEFSQAMLVRSADVKGVKTAKEKEMFAFTDEQYIEAADKHVEAKMFRLFVEEKKDSFSKAHYLVRKIVDREQIVDSTSISDGPETGWFQTPGS